MEYYEFENDLCIRISGLEDLEIHRMPMVEFCGELAEMHNALRLLGRYRWKLFDVGTDFDVRVDNGQVRFVDDDGQLSDEVPLEELNREITRVTSEAVNLLRRDNPPEIAEAAIRLMNL